MGRFGPDHRPDQMKEQDPKSPEMGQDLADIVTAGAEDGEDCVADAPLSGHLARRPSVFMCPISGSIALRRLRSFARSGVMPRLVPLIRTLVVSTPWPR